MNRLTLVLKIAVTLFLIIEIYRHLYVYYLRWKVNKLDREIQQLKNKINYGKTYGS
jgi:cell division protein FtsL